MYIHNIILKRKRVFTTLHDVACSFLFMHIKKTTASALVFHFLTIYLLLLLFAHIFVFCVFRYAFSFHFFCCSFLYFLYRYNGMPIMTLRQMMIKTMVRTTLLMMLTPIL